MAEGSIQPGTLASLLDRLRQAKRSALIVCEQGDRAGHIILAEGALAGASLDGSGEMRVALEGLLGWTTGWYTLTELGVEHEPARRVRLVMLTDRPDRLRGVEQWLGQQGYQVFVLADPTAEGQIIEFLSPDVLLIDCPKGRIGLTCSEYRAALAERHTGAPLIVTMADPSARCPQPDERCLERPVSSARLGEVLARFRPNARPQ